MAGHCYRPRVARLFAIQHTLMARASFKRWIARYIPQAAERGTFVLSASFCLPACSSGNGHHCPLPSGQSELLAIYGRARNAFCSACAAATVDGTRDSTAALVFRLARP